MSEQICVTVQNGQKQNKMVHSVEKTLLDTLRDMGEQKSLCAGRGTCGRCEVRFLTAAPLPVPADRKHFSAEQLREGYRLACMAKPTTDCTVELHFRSEPHMEAVAGYRLSAEGTDGAVFAAVDLGTTTVAMQKIENGQAVRTYTFLNPQRAYGTDVLSRIQQAAAGQGEVLRTLLLTELEKGLRVLEEGSQIQFIVFAGNTPMLHILLGYEVSALGRKPFRTVDISYQKISLLGYDAHILPGISAFVGADITAGMYHCGFESGREKRLLVDLGTNGEMVLGNSEKRIAAAAAAGPAFEGGDAGGIHGAEMISIAAGLLAERKMDNTGLLSEPYFTQGIRLGKADIRQEDIRGLQMAKAAVRAGIEILLREYGVTPEEVERVYLAGGFGYYLDVDAAFAIGLLPACFAGKTVAVGNSSLAGCVRFGGRQDETALNRLAEKTETLNLAECADFQTLYIENMGFKLQT